jgi:hypothetical protein
MFLPAGPLGLCPEEHGFCALTISHGIPLGAAPVGIHGATYKVSVGATFPKYMITMRKSLLTYISGE